MIKIAKTFFGNLAGFLVIETAGGGAESKNYGRFMFIAKRRNLICWEPLSRKIKFLIALAFQASH